MRGSWRGEPSSRSTLASIAHAQSPLSTSRWRCERPRACARAASAPAEALIRLAQIHPPAVRPPPHSARVLRMASSDDGSSTVCHSCNAEECYIGPISLIRSTSLTPARLTRTQRQLASPAALRYALASRASVRKHELCSHPNVVLSAHPSPPRVVRVARRANELREMRQRWHPRLQLQRSPRIESRQTQGVCALCCGSARELMRSELKSAASGEDVDQEGRVRSGIAKPPHSEAQARSASLHVRRWPLALPSLPDPNIFKPISMEVPKEGSREHQVDSLSLYLRAVRRCNPPSA